MAAIEKKTASHQVQLRDWDLDRKSDTLPIDVACLKGFHPRKRLGQGRFGTLCCLVLFHCYHHQLS